MKAKPIFKGIPNRASGFQHLFSYRRTKEESEVERNAGYNEGVAEEKRRWTQVFIDHPTATKGRLKVARALLENTGMQATAIIELLEEMPQAHKSSLHERMADVCVPRTGSEVSLYAEDGRSHSSMLAAQIIVAGDKARARK